MQKRTTDRYVIPAAGAWAFFIGPLATGVGVHVAVVISLLVGAIGFGASFLDKQPQRSPQRAERVHRSGRSSGAQRSECTQETGCFDLHGARYHGPNCPLSPQRTLPGPDARAVSDYLNADPMDPTATLGFLDRMEGRSGGGSSVSLSKTLDYVGKVKRPLGPPQPVRAAPRHHCGDCTVIVRPAQYGNEEFVCNGECFNRPIPRSVDVWAIKQQLALVQRQLALKEAEGYCKRHGRSIDKSCLFCKRQAALTSGFSRPKL